MKIGTLYIIAGIFLLIISLYSDNQILIGYSTAVFVFGLFKPRFEDEVKLK